MIIKKDITNSNMTDMIETIIQISHGKITLDINKIKKCKLLCCK